MGWEAPQRAETRLKSKGIKKPSTPTQKISPQIRELITGAQVAQGGLVGPRRDPKERSIVGRMKKQIKVQNFFLIFS